MSTNSSPLFSSLEQSPEKPRWVYFVASYAVQVIAVSGLLLYMVVAPHIGLPTLQHVQLVAPDLVPSPKPVPKPLQKLAALEPAPVVETAPKLSAPVLQAPQPQRLRRMAEVAEVAQPKLNIDPKLDPKLLASLPTSKPKIIATNTFGSSAAPSLQNIATSKVQTGGFGDPNGVPANSRGGRPNIAVAGGFDLPQGGGYGNGSGGSKGVRGTVASAGFGNSVAVQGGKTGQGRIQSTGFGTPAAQSSAPVQGRVQSTGFGTVAAPATAPKVIAHQAESAPLTIQSKPTPAYTSEARQLRVEGEVLLNVVFTADGKVRILNVVRGLGHGLDEAAQRAAQGVRFTPAIHDGRPVDSTVTLHIVFQLS